MSKEGSNTVIRPKKRFKGIENFLKRVAFNLGNTPSQTEVKIISCIPIDVTDLQQKIVHLERQLETYKCRRGGVVSCSGGSGAHVVHSFSSKGSKVLKNWKQCNLCKQSSHGSIIESRFGKPISETTNKSFDCYQYTDPICLEPKSHSNDSYIRSTNTNVNELLNDNIDNSEVFKGIEAKNCDMYSVISAPKTKQRQSFFRKKKRFLKSKKGTCPCVYYAQTNSSPFIYPDLREDALNYDRNDTITRSYLTTMINKQYKPKMLGDNMSIQSQFSSPVCRDVQPHEQNRLFESDICSCCYDPFHNIDKYVIKQNNYQSYMVQEMNTGSAFYDINQYDLVPVREKPVKIKKDLERARHKEPKPQIDMKCWPEKVRTKHRYNSLFPLATSSHCSVRPRANHTLRDKLDSYGRKVSVKLNGIEPISRLLAKRRKEMYRKERPINMDTSRCCSVDFGNVYHKKTSTNPKITERFQPIKSMKNAECLTTAINNSECQTEMSNIDERLPTDSKTEATLTQIKSILQSVLAEVKVSSQTKGPDVEKKPKKDAVVQKGSLPNNMKGSVLMNTYTYSPFSMNPACYGNSGSQQNHPSQYCNPPGAMKCLHNYPVFIHHPGGRQGCSNCYRTTQIKPDYIKLNATTTATNTDEVKEEYNKETEKLIKEIYKSMALTVEYLNKDTSLSEYDDTMKSIHHFTRPIILKTTPKKKPKTIKTVVQAVSELFMNKDMRDTSATLDSTMESRLPSHVASIRSHVVPSTDTELRRRKNRVEQFSSTPKQPETVVEKKTFREAMVQNDDSITESETSSSEAESDTTIVTKVQTAPVQHKKEKEGLLAKMLKSVKLFKLKEKPKKRTERVVISKEETSDSDDYQTVCSQKIEKNVKNRSHLHNQPKRKTHSKISYKQNYQRTKDGCSDKKRAPYMEQEYRRCWDEALIFQNNRPQNSSEKQYFKPTSREKSAYYRTYDARTAVVDPKIPVGKNEPSINRENGTEYKMTPASKGMAWLKKHKMGMNYGEQWKKLVTEG